MPPRKADLSLAPPPESRDISPSTAKIPPKHPRSTPKALTFGSTRGSDTSDLDTPKPRSEASKAWTEKNLTPTDEPGVYLNRAGVRVDYMGVMIGFNVQTPTEEQTRLEQIFGGPIDSPAKLLKAASMDYSLPLLVRVQIAKDAAPYFDRKMPVRVEDVTPPSVLAEENLKKLSVQELDELQTLLVKLGMSV